MAQILNHMLNCKEKRELALLGFLLGEVKLFQQAKRNKVVRTVIRSLIWKLERYGVRKELEKDDFKAEI